MIQAIFKYKFQKLFRFDRKVTISLLGLIIALLVVVIITGIAIFEFNFDVHYANSERIYRIQNNRIYPNLVDESAGCPPATAPTIKQEVKGIAEAARIRALLSSIITIKKNNTPSYFTVDHFYYADHSYLKIVNHEFLYGNPEEALSKANTAVITQSFARKYFGHENVLGKFFTCSNVEGQVDLEITGVIKDVRADSYFQFDCLVSYKTLVNYNEEAEFTWGWNAFNTFLLLEESVSKESVEQQLKELVKNYKLSYNGMQRVLELQPLKSIHLTSNLRHEIGLRGNKISLKILMAIALFILVIAWINYINIASSKSKKEMLEAEMKAIFGNKKSLRILESIFDAILMNTIGLMIAFVLMKIFSTEFNHLYQIEIHHLSLFYWFCLIGFTYFLAIVAGMIPAVYQERNFHLKNSSLHHTGKKYISIRNGLIVFQFTVSSIFIIATLIVFQQIRYIDNKQESLELKNTIILSSLPAENQLISEQNTFAEELTKIPEIVAVSTSSSVPGANYSNVIGGIRPTGVDLEKGIKCHFVDVNEHFFQLYQIDLIAGQNFYSEGKNPPNRIIVNRKAAKMMGFDDPAEILNKEVIMEEYSGEKRVIVGVVENFHHQSLDEPIQPLIYHYRSKGHYISIKYKYQLTNNLLTKLKKVWKVHYPQQPFEFQSNDLFYAMKYGKHKIFSKLISTFALLIILISGIGLYALAIFSISNKTKEIGIRKANGAKTYEVVNLLNKGFMKWVVLAFVIACPIAWYTMNLWLQSFAFRIQISWWIFILAGAIITGIALLTVSLQSWKAASKNPVESLRYE